jgi:hypothetical protein
MRWNTETTKERKGKKEEKNNFKLRKKRRWRK